VLGVAYFYHVNISQSSSLVQSGVIAIALLSQTFPILLLGLYWKRGTTLAAQLALTSGALCWVYWLLWPSITASYYFNDTPTDMQLAQGFVYSLAVNILCFVAVSLMQNMRNLPASQDPMAHNSQPFGHAVKVSNLLAITEKVWGAQRHQALLEKLTPEQLTGYASPKLLTTIESELAGQVGSASARILLSAIGEKRDVELSELVELVEEASQTFQFNHELLQSSVENIQQGIVVLDRNLTLLAWNQRYIELFNYPRGFVQVGMSIHQILQFNAKRGLFGHNADTGRSNIEMEIEKRVAFMQSGSAYKYVRHQENGQVIELNGRPLPGGGFVTTYSDITEYINIQQQLEQAKSSLESRVEERTEQLQIANINLEKARREAESANDSKTKFLAAAGHDLMQPFNAASLFAAMIKQKAPAGEMAQMSANLVDSLKNAESLLTMLLDMTRLESGILTTHIQTFPLNSILRPMVTEFSVLAQQKGLRVTYVSTSLTVISDPKLLRRIIQNLLSNAIRYTQKGRILVGVKRLNGMARICVIDTGAGIAKEKQQEIFLEFHQLDTNPSAQGLGLGLTIVERISALLQHPVSLQSTLDRGTSFDIAVPIGEKHIIKEGSVKQIGNDVSLPLKGKRMLIVDNEPHILDALQRLLVDWGAIVVAAKDSKEALDALTHPIDLMILDYQLDHGETGTGVAKAIRQIMANSHDDNSIPGILNSARQDDAIRQLAIDEQMHYLPKPLKPVALKRLIKQLLAEK
jgi:signal transduction histidine kinase